MPARGNETATLRNSSALSSLKLFAGEQVLWHGKPKSGIVFTGYDAWLIPFSIVWFGFTIFMASSAHGASNLRFSAVTTFFLAIGFYMAIGRLAVDWLFRSRLDYVITTQRIVILSHLWRGTVHSISRPNIEVLRLQEFRDGTGTIHFTRASWAFFVNGYSEWHACLGRDPMLFRISDARLAYDLLKRGPS